MVLNYTIKGGFHTKSNQELITSLTAGQLSVLRGNLNSVSIHASTVFFLNKMTFQTEALNLLSRYGTEHFLSFTADKIERQPNHRTQVNYYCEWMPCVSIDK